MKATDVLRHEHETILEALRVLDRFGRIAADGGELSLPDLRVLLDFLTRFADGCHHAKEEELLFPLLEDRGLPRDGGPIAVMLHEHDEGRALIASMRTAAGDLEAQPSARRAFAVAAAGYRSLLQAHIGKENEVLFRIADGLLDGPDHAALVDSFAARERERLPDGGHARWQQAVQDLARRYLRVDPAQASRSGEAPTSAR